MPEKRKKTALRICVEGLWRQLAVYKHNNNDGDDQKQGDDQDKATITRRLLLVLLHDALGLVLERLPITRLHPQPGQLRGDGAAVVERGRLWTAVAATCIHWDVAQVAFQRSLMLCYQLFVVQSLDLQHGGAAMRTFGRAHARC